MEFLVAGEISLPGGKAEGGDMDNRDTTTRKAKEEIGLDPSLVEVVIVLERFLSKVWKYVSSVLLFCFHNFVLQLKVEGKSQDMLMLLIDLKYMWFVWVWIRGILWYNWRSCESCDLSKTLSWSSCITLSWRRWAYMVLSRQ